MTESSILEAQKSSGSLFPPAPEESRSAAAPKKRAAKKTVAKKASAKKATAKKTTAEKSAPLPAIIAEAARPPALVAAPAPAPAAKPAKKVTRARKSTSTSSNEGDPAPSRPVEVPAPSAPPEVSPVREPVQPRPVAPAPTQPVEPTVPQPSPATTPTIPPELPTQGRAEGTQARSRVPRHERERDRDRDYDRRNDQPRDRSNDQVRDRSNDQVRDRSNDQVRDRSNEQRRDRSNDQPRDRSNDQVRDRSIDQPRDRDNDRDRVGDRVGDRDRDRGGDRDRGNDRGGRFRNKWEKRSKRFRDRNDRGPIGEGGPQRSPQGEGGQQSAPLPERPLGPPEPSEGLLELTPKGYGYLRQKSRQYASFNQDPWVSPEWIRTLGLREGMYITGVQQEGHRGPQVTQITEVNGMDPEKVRDLPLFEELKAINPNKRIQLETRPDRLTTRVMDLVTPVGRGQRGLIVAPPRAGKTTLLQHIAEAVTEKHPDLHLMILLVDERPEEVTEFRRTLPNAEIHASSNDSDVKNHMRTASFAIERAKRLVEAGQHVFMLLDSITRMGRAFNNAHKGSATMSGGVGVGALELPRRLFAAARNTRDAGSLTILATTLIETNSRMDELIFQEFKGTGNLELVLDRKIAEQYIYPAVNIFKSGTRREELLLPAFQMERIHLLRRGLAGHKPIDAVQRVITLLERSPNNAQMLVELPGGKGSINV